MKTSSLLMLICVACNPTTTPSSEPKDPREPKFSLITNDRPLGVSPQDDIEFIVRPAWHPGKEYPLTQHLKANPVIKEKLNVSHGSAIDAARENQ